MEKPIALYHRVMRRENFEKAAKDLFYLLRAAEAKAPGVPRILYVDIDGHLDENGDYDQDMTELQRGFGDGFLQQYFTEMHFPLASYKNPGPQRNDVPDKLEIENAQNRIDSSLNQLYIENYSNTEFMSEEDVYSFLQSFCYFLKAYNSFCEESVLKTQNSGDGWLNAWKKHVNNLINELFAIFLYGNLLSAAAMTRSLIECCIYLSIIIKEKDAALLDEWYICSTCLAAKGDDVGVKERVKNYCKRKKLDFKEKWNHYRKNRNANAWLHLVIPGKDLSFFKACEYLEAPQAYRDFQSASAFVHGQDIMSKIDPFSFYDLIFQRFYMMISYIFRAVRLFGTSEELEAQMKALEEALLVLSKKYLD